ncbi:hypothetical protein C0Q70_20394 [Pomacea canaliculata]|uniref:Exonuclease domain-containing protein n=2 Tax=Pomacea canaliculata TaxID=400727 RepID=A0A2T7NFF7_POMCA|nr:hypothetical protein C0Q70_20394 [Pomacea canaliculata]
MNNHRLQTTRVDEVSPHDRLIWFDLEMTGLDITKDKIIEIACMVTNGNLETVAEGPNIIIHQSEKVMSSMNEWCLKHHGESGLTQAVLESRVTEREAEKCILEFLQQHTEPGLVPLAGNSVYMDRLFLQVHMPQIANHLHYRTVDVSSVKELCRRWFPEEFKKAPKKKETHRALEDIKESIQELQFYRQSIFKMSC